MRARLRQTIFPWLNQAFGKQVQTNVIQISEEAQEIVHYFDQRLDHLFNHVVKGPWGTYLDLKEFLPLIPLEIKYLLRLLCAKQQFFLSRSIIEEGTQALLRNKANQCFMMGTHQIWIDRQRLFIIKKLKKDEMTSLEMKVENNSWGFWKLDITEEVYSSTYSITSWKEGWIGKMEIYLPKGSYTLDFAKSCQLTLTNLAAIKKRWNQAKVPAFLYDYFPVIRKESLICHEFLTGKPLIFPKEKELCWKICLTYDDSLAKNISLFR